MSLIKEKNQFSSIGQLSNLSNLIISQEIAVLDESGVTKPKTIHDRLRRSVTVFLKTVQRKVKIRKKRPTTAAGLEAVLRDEWKKLSQGVIENLIGSIPNR